MAKHFLNSEINLGTIKRTQQKVLFVGKRGMPSIIEVKVGCSKCMSAQYNKKINAVAVVYNPAAIPKHLVRQGKNSYKARKIVNIRYSTGERDLLILNATVTK